MGKDKWSHHGGSALYSEKVFPNGKVGNVLKNQTWVAALDGNQCGFVPELKQAQDLVDAKYKEVYGG